MAALWARRVWSIRMASVGWPPAIGQQVLESAVGQHGQPCEHVLEVGVRVPPIELGPWAYLRDVLARIHSHPASRIDELLPHRWRPT